MNKLKECPFCGGEVSITAGLGMSPNYHFTCCKCRLMTSSDHWEEEDAVKAFNRRVDDWVSVNTPPKEGEKVKVRFGIIRFGEFQCIIENEGVFKEKLYFSNIEPEILESQAFCLTAIQWKPLPEQPKG